MCHSRPSSHSHVLLSNVHQNNVLPSTSKPNTSTSHNSSRSGGSFSTTMYLPSFEGLQVALCVSPFRSVPVNFGPHISWLLPDEGILLTRRTITSKLVSFSPVKCKTQTRSKSHKIFINHNSMYLSRKHDSLYTQTDISNLDDSNL